MKSGSSRSFDGNLSPLSADVMGRGALLSFLFFVCVTNRKRSYYCTLLPDEGALKHSFTFYLFEWPHKDKIRHVEKKEKNFLKLIRPDDYGAETRLS